ncbi:(2Fe-2S)-binding protein [Paenibacillus sp. NPDC058071]|uniref:putative iron-sulfur cluster-binding metallochaperone n=1 Tax=Paenibacillus sp. NPDC058071 TaxID=3346326 RepID=UPI0036D7FC4E
MESCCHTPTKESSNLILCPVCRQKGKSVPLITLKALLQPTSLETIDPASSYAFCSNSSCEVVYFSDIQTFNKTTLKVPVFQKDDALDAPVCYCFGWTRERIRQAVQDRQHPNEHIREQVQANRCGCEVNNPQGSCCLGNVTTVIRSFSRA